MKPEPKPIMKHPLLLITGKASPAMMLAAGLCLALALPSQAKDLLLGTPGALPVDDGYTFTNSSTTGPIQQGVIVSSSGTSFSGTVSSEWWGADPEPFGLTNETQESKEVVAHVKTPLTGGDTYWMNMSFEYYQSEYKGLLRGNQNGLFLPTATEIFFGFQYFNDGALLSTELSPNNLTFVGTSAPTAADGFDAAQIPALMDDWYNYTITDGSTSWELILEDKGDDALLQNWVVGIVLPADWAATSTYTGIDDLLIDGYDKKGKAITVGPGEQYYPTVNGDDDPPQTNTAGTDDIFFRWTVDEKGTALSDPDNPLYNPQDPDKWLNPDFVDQFEMTEEIIPEPSSAGLLMLGALALVMRRKRA